MKSDEDKGNEKAKELILSGRWPWEIRRSNSGFGSAVAITRDGYDILHLNPGTVRNEYCVVAFVARLNALDRLGLPNAIIAAKAALVGDSNDSEHDALVSLVVTLGEGLAPECECPIGHGPEYGRDEPHTPVCPCAAWEAKS